MILKLRTTGQSGAQGLRQKVEGCAERVLGRLKRRVSHAVISLCEHERQTGDSVHVCSLRLRVPGSRDTLIESLRPDPDSAVDSAFRRARRELLRHPHQFTGRQQSLPSPT